MQKRRTEKRIDAQIQAAYYTKAAVQWESCLLIDVSRCGIGMMTGGTLRPDAVLFFNIALPRGTVKVVGKVMWVRPIKRRSSFNCVAGVALFNMTEGDRQAFIHYACSEFERNLKNWAGDSGRSCEIV